MLDHDFIIRPATRNDVGALAELFKALAEAVGDPPGAVDAERLAVALFSDSPTTACLVTEQRTQPVAAACFAVVYEAHTNQKVLWISDFVVAASERGSPVAVHLLDALVADARERECDRITGELWTKNNRARRFYERNGFEVCAHIDVIALDLRAN